MRTFGGTCGGPTSGGVVAPGSVFPAPAARGAPPEPGAVGYPDGMTDPLTRDLGPALHRVARDGVAHEPGVIPEALRRDVLAELDAERYAALPAVEGPHRVRQQGEHLVLVGDEITARPAVHALHRAVVAATAPHVPEWQPDEVTVQRYAPGSSGISTHLDGRRHRYLVAILTLEGSATLRHCTDREGTTAQSWDADAGSLVLLRGPGLAGISDGRPLHAVDGPRERRRTSLTLRARGPRDVTSRG